MALRTLLIRRFRIVNHRDEPIAVSLDIKHNVSSNVVSIAKHAANFGEAVPSNTLYYSDPRFNFVGRVGILLQGLLQVFSRHNVHASGYFTICEGVNGTMCEVGAACAEKKQNLVPGARIAHTGHSLSPSIPFRIEIAT